MISNPIRSRAAQVAINIDRPVADPLLYQLKPVRLPPQPRTRDLLSTYGIRAKKNLSQNFLLNQRLLRSIVRSAGVTPGCRVIEVGPGPGNLTRAILQQSPLEVLAIEKDRRFLPLLEQLADSVHPGQLKILLGDALQHNFSNVFGEDPRELASKYQLPKELPSYVYDFQKDWSDTKLPPIRVIGNLPFSISTALLIKYLHHISLRNSFWQYGRVPMLLTFQDEVARRICATPASSDRSRLSAMSQNYCKVEYLFRISGMSFTPSAGVNTGVVRFEPRVEPISSIPFKLYEKLIRHLFHHRNRNLEYNYKSLFPRDLHDEIMLDFEQARVNPKIFPYMISNKELGRLSKIYNRRCKDLPALAEFDYRASKKLLGEGTLKVLREAKLDLLSDNMVDATDHMINQNGQQCHTADEQCHPDV